MPAEADTTGSERLAKNYAAALDLPSSVSFYDLSERVPSGGDSHVLFRFQLLAAARP